MFRCSPQIGLSFGFQPLYPGQLSNSSALTATIGSAGTLYHPQAPRPSSNHVPQPEKGPSVPEGSSTISDAELDAAGAEDEVMEGAVLLLLLLLGAAEEVEVDVEMEDEEEVEVDATVVLAAAELEDCLAGAILLEYRFEAAELTRELEAGADDDDDDDDEVEAEEEEDSRGGAMLVEYLSEVAELIREEEAATEEVLEEAESARLLEEEEEAGRDEVEDCCAPTTGGRDLSGVVGLRSPAPPADEDDADAEADEDEAEEVEELAVVLELDDEAAVDVEAVVMVAPVSEVEAEHCADEPRLTTVLTILPFPLKSRFILSVLRFTCAPTWARPVWACAFRGTGTGRAAWPLFWMLARERSWAWERASPEVALEVKG
jgi:hypothetical protein